MLAGNMCKLDTRAVTKSDGMIVYVDEKLDDPQLCATIAPDIYKHLRASEVLNFFYVSKARALLA